MFNPTNAKPQDNIQEFERVFLNSTPSKTITPEQKGGKPTPEE